MRPFSEQFGFGTKGSPFPGNNTPQTITGFGPQQQKESPMKNLITPRAQTSTGRHVKTTSLKLACGLLTVSSFVLASLGAQAADPAYTFNVVTKIGAPAPGGGAFVSDFE